MAEIDVSVVGAGFLTWSKREAAGKLGGLFLVNSSVFYS